jgi:Fur family transcriptional regulator, zinc uptake regulator
MSDATAFHSHDHGHCTGTAMAHAERLARDRGLRLTPVRRRALEILLEEHRALGAYEVLERLAADGFRQPAAGGLPRARLPRGAGACPPDPRLNAYAACTHPGERAFARLLDLRDLQRRGRSAPPSCGHRSDGTCGGWDRLHDPSG